MSPEVHLQVREVTTTKRVPAEHKQNSSTLLVEEEESNKESPAPTFAYQHFSNRVPPEGSTVILDPIKAYYKSLKPRQEPDLDRLTVAKESMAIRSVYALVDSSQKVECTASVVEALSWFSAILVNKICKIMKIFEQLDHIRSRWVFCQH